MDFITKVDGGRCGVKGYSSRERQEPREDRQMRHGQDHLGRSERTLQRSSYKFGRFVNLLITCGQHIFKSSPWAALWYHLLVCPCRMQGFWYTARFLIKLKKSHP
jgi:hypothetical protein